MTEGTAAEERKNSKVDAYLARARKWQAEMEKLRSVILDCKLVEDLKWGKPCYTLDDRNIVLMMGFKDHCILLFPAGALLKDEKHLLVRPTENTQAARQMRFTSLQAINKATVKAYVQEAIAISKAGTKVEFKKVSEFTVPDELQQKLDANHALKAAFKALTPGRQRSYILHLSTAKQAKTRTARVESYVPRILAGKGQNEI